MSRNKCKVRRMSRSKCMILKDPPQSNHFTLRPYLSVDTNATQYPKTKKIERGAGGSTVPLSYLMWAALAPLCSLRACNLSDEKHGINTVVLWNPTVECRFRRTSIHFSVTHFNNIQMLCGRRMHMEFQI